MFDVIYRFDPDYREEPHGPPTPAAARERLIAEGRLGELSDPAALELRKRAREPGPVSPRDPAVLVDGALQAAS